MSGYGSKIKAVLAVLAVICLPDASAAAQSKSEKAKAEPLTAFELYQIYKDKTWVWKTGGGRFTADGRGLVAWVDDSGKQSFAEGRWTVNDLGQLCMRGTWTNAEGSARASTCFGHKKIGDTIYQKRQPHGEWYIFKHARTRSSDEFTKLVASDTVSMKARQLKKDLSNGRKP